jgi:hypothetical protein
MFSVCFATQNRGLSPITPITLYLVTVKKCFVKGTEEDFPEKTQNTSYIERFNLTLRQPIAYF